MNLQFDHDKLPKQWLHPADRAITIDEDNTQEDTTHINIYTDVSKSEQVVGAGIAIIRPGTTTVELMYRMDTRCTNNQVEAFAILKTLKYVQTNLENDVDKITKVYTDSRTTLESLHNLNKHTFLTEQIRRNLQEMGSREWASRFRWTKAHVGTTGNELADKLAEEASCKTEIPISYNRIPNKLDTKPNDNSNRPREHKIISTQV